MNENYELIKDDCGSKVWMLDGIAKLHLCDGIGDDDIDIILLSVQNPSKRRKGYGGRVLQDVCDWADQQAKRLMLVVEPQDEWGMDANQLRYWYMSQGFRQYTSKRTLLMRLPKSQEVLAP